MPLLVLRCPMKISAFAGVLSLALLPSLAAAQAAPAAPVAKAFRDFAADEGKNLVAAAQDMPAEKSPFKPTPAQMSSADIMVHLARANDFPCGAMGGVKAPQRSDVGAAGGKDALVARLKE